MIVVVETSFGSFKIRLFEKKAPATVKNFTELISGKKTFTGHLTNQPENRPFYDGLVFHRVVKNAFVQTGCPFGDGTGGPGYMFDDEIDALKNKHDKAGLVSMVNFAPNTNGSQFFITLAPMPWLDKSHTIFGEVTEGLELLKAMADTTPTKGDRPETPPKIIKMTVVENQI